MDNALIDYVAGEFRKETGIDLLKDKLAVTRLKEAVEKAKIELSNVVETELNLPFLTADATGPKHLTQKLTRSKLEGIIAPIIERCKGPVDRALKDAENNAKHSWKSIKDVTKIILVGGPTRMPIVQKFVEDYVGKKAERGIDPMECVALGAAVQGAVLTGEVKDILLLDVTPLTLGLETMGGVRTPLIDRNTTIPVKKSQIYSTASDNQGSVEIHVLQGERPLAKDNVSLGKFTLDGIPPAPRGVPQIDVSFDLDANGILHVTAKDLGTKKEQSIKISSPSKLSKDEVDKFVKQAEQFSDEDKRHKDEIEAKNLLDGLVYSTEKSLKEHGGNMSGDERLNVDRALSQAKDALKGTDVDTLKKAYEELTTASHKLAESIYKAAEKKEHVGAAAGGAGHGNGNGNGGHQAETVDAEVVSEATK
jgi:molecular chaperone DnaK